MSSTTVRFQYSLRSLFIVTAALAICMATVVWFGALGGLILLGLVGIGLCGTGYFQKSRARTVTGIGMLAMTAFVLYFDLTETGVIDGEYPMTARVHVVDAGTGDPVGGADVAIVFRGRQYGPGCKTNLDGSAVWRGAIPFSYRFSGLGITRKFPSEHRNSDLTLFELYVRADGFKANSASLSDATGRKQWPRNGSALPPITVKLARNRSSVE